MLRKATATATSLTSSSPSSLTIPLSSLVAYFESATLNLDCPLQPSHRSASRTSGCLLVIYCTKMHLLWKLLFMYKNIYCTWWFGLANYGGQFRSNRLYRIITNSIRYFLLLTAIIIRTITSSKLMRLFIQSDGSPVNESCRLNSI